MPRLLWPALLSGAVALPAAAQPIVQPVPPVVQPVQPSPVLPAGIFGRPPAPTEERARSARRQIATGSLLFGISNGAAWTLAIALGPADRRAWWLALPLGGPAVWGALWGCRDVSSRSACRPLLATGGGFWSAIQLGGAVVLLIGIVRLPGDGPRVGVGPLVHPHARGLALWASL